MKKETFKMGERKDNELYELIIAAYKRSKKALEELSVFEDAEKYSQAYENGTWKSLDTSNRPDYLSKVDIAIPFDIVETKLAMTTSQPPSPDVDASINADNQEYMMIAETIKNSEDQMEVEQAEKALESFKERLDEYSESIQRELVRIWEDTKMHSKNQRLFREMGATGTSGVKSVFDAEKKKFVNSEIDLLSLKPSPNCDSILDHAVKGEIFIYETVMTVDQIKKEFQIEAIDEQALGTFDDQQIFRTRTPGYREQLKAAVKSTLEFTKDKKGSHCIVLEAYMPDDGDQTIDIKLPEYDADGFEVKDDEGNVKTKPGKRKRFPSGFKVVTIIYNHKGWILREEENLYKDGRPPFFLKRNYPKMGKFHGTSEIKHIFDLVQRVNGLCSAMSDNIKYFGNPMLLKGEGTTAADGGPITNEAGLILDSPTGTDRFLVPPTHGAESRWLLEFFVRFINQISRLDSALRGVNENASDSGRKVRELRMAATGLLQPAMDEEIFFIVELFEHWTYILQNLYEGSILQKVEDVNGKANFEEFVPSAGRDINLSVNVSSESILPKDIWSEWEEALALYGQVIAEDGVTRLITPEMLIDAAPTFSSKQSAKAHVGRAQEKVNFEKQKMKAFEQFQELAPMVSEVSEQAAGSPDEDELIGQLTEILQIFPEFIRTNEFKALPERAKLAILGILAEIGMQENIKQEGAGELGR